MPRQRVMGRKGEQLAGGKLVFFSITLPLESLIANDPFARSRRSNAAGVGQELASAG